MQRSQLVGGAICAAVVVQVLALAIGILRKSYWAVALPVAAGAGAVSALAFWIGWTMLSTDVDAQPEEEL